MIPVLKDPERSVVRRRQRLLITVPADKHVFRRPQVIREKIRLPAVSRHGDEMETRCILTSLSNKRGVGVGKRSVGDEMTRKGQWLAVENLSAGNAEI